MPNATPPTTFRFTAAAAVLPALLAAGCAGHADHTAKARSALDAGRPAAALAAYNEQLEVDSAASDPGELGDDQVLYLLDRAVVLQQLGETELSSRDLEIADKRIELLDFSAGSLDDIGKYMFSDDTGVYAAPSYEKLLINTLNMMNYLDRHDLNGARVEARRFSVMRKFITESSEDSDNGGADVLSAAGSYLAGFVFEKSNQAGEALRYYDEALGVSQFPSLRNPVRRLSAIDPYDSPALRTARGEDSATAPVDDRSGEVLVIVNYGRVPAKVAKRIPIGLALTYAAVYMTPEQTSRTNYLAAQGLVTWINYPTLGESRGKYAVPHTQVDGQSVALDGLLAVDQAARAQWKRHEGKVIASAITRMITRVVAGETARRVSGGGVVGALLSLGTQATMTATDTPDTRNWATLPARIAVGRLRVQPGKHRVRVSVSGREKTQEIDMPERGWAVVVLTVLR